MAYVSVPKDLTKVKNKVAFNLTKRQLICIDSQNVRKKKKHRLQKQRKPEKNSRIKNRKQRNTIWNSNIRHKTR